MDVGHPSGLLDGGKSWLYFEMFAKLASNSILATHPLSYTDFKLTTMSSKPHDLLGSLWILSLSHELVLFDLSLLNMTLSY